MRVGNVTLKELLDVLIIVGLVALFLITFVIRTFYIPSVSMVPTLQVRDVLLVDEIAYRLARPHDGDVALFIPPVPAGGNDFVKRVIGVPGDTIRHSRRYRLPKWRCVWSNPTRISRRRTTWRSETTPSTLTARPLDSRGANVPPRPSGRHPTACPNGFYFVLGDNRNYSDDSHVWGFAQLHGSFAGGPLAGRRIKAAFTGRAFAIVWPLGRLHILEK